MIGTIILLLVIAVWLFCIGYFTPKLTKWFYSSEGFNFRHESDARWMGFLSVAFLPIALPIIVGLYLYKWEGDGADRHTKKQRREIEDAKHQVELAKLRAEEDRILDHQLAQLRK